MINEGDILMMITISPLFKRLAVFWRYHATDVCVVIPPASYSGRATDPQQTTTPPGLEETHLIYTITL